MKNRELRIVGMETQEPVAATGPAGTVQEKRFVVEVENPGNEPLHVWASRRGYDYDAGTRVLTVYLTDQIPGPPPGIKMISSHPRTPAQVVVEPGRRARIEVRVPAAVRRRLPGTGMGMSFVEEPIGPVDRLDLHIQYASEPLQSLAGESPAAHQQRLRAHGQVMRTTITPTGSKER